MYFTIDESELITTDNYLDFCKNNNISYAKTDYFYDWGYDELLKKSQTSNFFWRGEYHPKLLDKFCVIGHSDYPVTEKIMENFDFVFTVNKSNKNTNCIPIPLGLCNYTTEHSKMPIFGDKKIVIETMNEYYEKEFLSYINLDVTTNKSERSYVKNKFSDSVWVKHESPDNSISGRKKYLTELKKSKFVFCPQGNGVDTHRLWETLYMGSIPIVIYHETHENLKELPILFIKSWDEINENFLLNKYEEFEKLSFNYEMMTQSYWNNLIKIKYNEYKKR